MEVRTLFRSLLALALCWLSFAATAATIFQDGFESGALGPGWIVSASEDGRSLVTTNFSPAAGDWHLVLDDSMNDTVYSVAEATLALDLSHKKNVVLSFKAKSLGNEPDYPPQGNFVGTRQFDGVSISTDGGTTWRTVQSLATVGAEWGSFFVPLDASVAALGGGYSADFRIRFSEYDNASAPLDGIALDQVSVTADDDQRTVLEMPTPLVEGTGPYTGYVLLAFAPTQALTLNLTAASTNQLVLPATVTILPGQTYASFEFSVAENSLVDLTRTVAVTATTTNVAGIPASITILDNDAPIGTLLLPAQVVEGQLPSNNATFQLDRAPAVPLTINLTAAPAGEISLPASLTIPAGQTQAVFTVRAVDDTRIDGDISVTVTATCGSMPTVSVPTVAVDNEPRTLLLSFPATMSEGATATGTVSIPGTLTAPLDVNLTSGNEAALTVPSTVRILAGQTNTTFALTAVDNALHDGTRLVSITATAPAFTNASRTMSIRDNDAATFRFSALSDIINVSSPLRLSIQAADVEGNIISNFTGTVQLSVILPDGSTQALLPPSINLSGSSGWTGSVTFPALNTAPLRLRAIDSNGRTGESTPFDIMRVMNVTAADLVWDPLRNQLYASVPANAADTNANKVVAIDPLSAQITGSVLAAPDPGQLALTSAGEYLYVALDGNGSVGQINPATMKLLSSFAVGTDPYYGTLYVADMCTVAGQPNLLVISQRRTSVSPEHNGVAVYDNGIRRPNKTQDHTGSNVIEPSADPNIFFGYNTESTEYGFRRLRLDANGMTQLEVNGSLISGFGVDIRSDGDRVFATTGVELNGAEMRRLGSFGVTGPVRPDLAANRVYFLESDGYYYYTYDTCDRIGAYDPNTFVCIRKLMLPKPVSSAASFIRWGTNGLAFRTDTNIVLITSSQLVPSGAPANLAVTVQASPNPATVSLPLTYTVCLSNQGPNAAIGSILGATLSDNQTLQSVSASAGVATISNSVVTLTVGNLAAGATVTLTLTTLPQSAGGLSCIASATSQSIDPIFTDNLAVKLVSVGFQSAMDTVNRVRLNANNLIYDPTRNLLWASLPATVPAPLGRSVISIDPTTGLMSDPISINGNPVGSCMALSGNGRYLYIGLSDSPEVHRLDLSASSPTSRRIPLGMSQWGDANYAEDIEVLDGDGTSFLVACSDDHAAAVFDGVTRRPMRTGIYTVDRIERTGTPGLFVGYNNYTSGFELSSLAVTAEGVAITRSVSSLISGYYAQLAGAGNLVLASTGVLADSTNLTLKANFGVSGRPCLDIQYKRAYLVNGSSLRGFDTDSLLSTGSFNLQVSQSGDWAQTCLRWGFDGFAILGNDGMLYIVRWSATIPASIDANRNGIADAWEAAYFGSLQVKPFADGDGDGICDALEYLYGTSPFEASANPLQHSVTNAAGQKMLRLVFPRRSGLAPQPYGYELSADLNSWTPAQNVTETVLETQTLNGVQIETVEALVPATNGPAGFVRFKWLVR